MNLVGAAVTAWCIKRIVGPGFKNRGRWYVLWWQWSTENLMLGINLQQKVN